MEKFQPRRLGVFGGTFDPLHVGHVVAALWAREACGLDEVLMTVAGTPWQKAATRAISDAEVRFEAVEAAVAGVDGLRASRIELDLGGDSHTARTLDALAAVAPDTSFTVIVGTDAARGLETWREADRLREMAEFAVVSRAGEPPFELDGWKLRHVEIPALDISSTQLRGRIAKGENVDFLVPSAALVVYLRERLYA